MLVTRCRKPRDAASRFAPPPAGRRRRPPTFNWMAELGIPEYLARSESASFYRILLIVVLAGWTTVARLVRGAVLSVREHDFVRAAVALGARPVRIMVAHLLPNNPRAQEP
jgi:ABC-type dipeptide/oligopeptide/nickel transport system permease subunit